MKNQSFCREKKNTNNEKNKNLQEKDYQEETGLECKAVVDGYSDFIFINRFGNVQHQGTLNKALRRIIRDCNYEVLDKGEKDPVLLPKFRNHSLRHVRLVERKIRSIFKEENFFEEKMHIDRIIICTYN